MENIDWIAWSAVVGALLPLVISLVKGANMTRGVKQFIALAVSGVAAVVVVAADQMWVFDNWPQFANQALVSFGLIFAEAQTFYTGFWEDRAVEVRLANVGSHQLPQV